jgi:uncharacterized membrane protein
MVEQAEKVGEKVKEKLSGGGETSGGSLASKLVVPAAAAAGTLASSYAAKKLPELIRNHVVPRLEDKGGDALEDIGRRAADGVRGAVSGAGGLPGKAAEKLMGGGDDEKQTAQGWGRGRRLPAQFSIDVAVPVRVAYDQWTQFEDFPEFMHRVERIEQRDDDTLVWHENIWGVRRSWRAEIVEQVPDERIAWRSDDRGGHSGVVTFHALARRLTRIELNVDFQPEGLLEKMSSGLRFHRRALNADLHRFKAFVEMREEETGAWRGRIENAERNPARENGGSGSDGDVDPGELGKHRREREQRRRERQKTAAR